MKLASCQLPIASVALVVVASAALAKASPAVDESPSATQPSRTVSAIDEYRIGPGDVLQVFVWREGELSRDVTVRTDGKITVPLVGDVEATGRTPRQLAAELGVSYGRFLSSPQVTLGVSQANSSRFYVIGQVNKPGEFPLSARLTALQGLALAGGLKEFAKADSIVILRREGGTEVAKALNYKRLEAGRDLSQNLELRPGDTIVVP